MESISWVFMNSMSKDDQTTRPKIRRFNKASDVFLRRNAWITELQRSRKRSKIRWKESSPVHKMVGSKLEEVMASKWTRKEADAARASNSSCWAVTRTAPITAPNGQYDRAVIWAVLIPPA